MGNNVIKSIFPNQCPHCNKQIMVSIQTVSPVITSICTEEDIKEAKLTVKIEAKKMLTGEDLETTLVWLDDDETVFGAEDIPSIIESFKK